MREPPRPPPRADIDAGPTDGSIDPRAAASSDAGGARDATRAASSASFDELHQRFERLQRLTEALARARTPRQVAHVAITDGVQAADAPRGTIGLLVNGGHAFELLAATGYDEAALAHWRRFANEPGLPIADVVASRRPVIVPDLPALERLYPRASQFVQAGAYCAAAVYPLVSSDDADARVLGFLGFDYDRPQAFAAPRLEMFALLARVCAQSMDRALAHEAERRARDAAEAASRAKDEFLATLSHELRTPLNAILGWAHLLRVGQLDAAQMQRGLETIERNARAQSHMIEEMLDATRLAAGDVRLALQSLPLADAVNAACHAMQAPAEAKGIALDCEMIDTLPPVRGDRERVEQMVRCLLANAIKFTPGGGRVWVDARPVGARLELSVHDTGQGIEPDFLPHVFERFRQADGSITREHGGLGLGLTIVRHLTELHGGTVRAHSAGRDQGATFVVTLPIAQERERERPAA